MKKIAQQAWGGRFSASPSKTARQFSESVSFDWRLYKNDIAGSIAHAKGLQNAGIINKKEALKIERGLRSIEKEIEKGTFHWDANREDVHMNIEAALVKKIGSTGAKLHTARSRNDQVATDLRLWVREAINRIDDRICYLQKMFVRKAKEYSNVIIPAYTHLQRAQPVLIAHHLLAYVEMLHRDRLRFADCYKRVNQCPLGSGALAGSTIQVDRNYVAKLLGFDSVTTNSMDAVSDRDFVVEFHASAALVGMHLSRLSEDLILWSSFEFGFVTISDEYTTGSSLMPQKKNPDIAELTRGKTGRFYGNLISALTVLKGLPLTYNRDMQEDKQPLFDTYDTLDSVLQIMADMLKKIRVNVLRCESAARDSMLMATDLADYLVRQGMPFRDAHHCVGSLVAEAEKGGKLLQDIAVEKFGSDVKSIFDLRRSLHARSTVGSPSPRNVKREIARWGKSLS